MIPYLIIESKQILVHRKNLLKTFTNTFLKWILTQHLLEEPIKQTTPIRLSRQYKPKPHPNRSLSHLIGYNQMFLSTAIFMFHLRIKIYLWMHSNQRRLEYRRKLLKTQASQTLWSYKAIEVQGQKLKKKMTRAILLVLHIQHLIVLHLAKQNNRFREQHKRHQRTNQFQKEHLQNQKILLERYLINKRKSHPH